MRGITKIFIIVFTILLSITFSGCKKDLISVESERRYSENLPLPPGGWGIAMSLTIRPNGTATLVEEGDMASEGKYKIRGDKLIFKSASQVNDWKFSIISENEIHAPKGQKLTLR